MSDYEAERQARLVAIDPVGCGCTECLIGEYVPLDSARSSDIQRLLRGEIHDNTHGGWIVSFDAYDRMVGISHSEMIIHVEWDEFDIKPGDIAIPCTIIFEWRPGTYIPDI